MKRDIPSEGRYLLTNIFLTFQEKSLSCFTSHPKTL